ncbi:TetR/AcrR family transcriptional regulator [Gordonia sp. HY285]|uniref:TetR/AcrR family transcriptional regulator n=1 Tax=Gordonia liuliyuniae TaxID=2911517 RepID=UPI001F30E400|nr:TetR/AcrR family transcriptional regulator [Gordonia liuliyuniae]MCF8608729.1 TetR/AcrR family transcriptional regulator [Gordonia liuliyuniae]
MAPVDSTPCRRTPASQVRSSLVTAGRKILETKGPSGLTVRAVASAAGVAPMGVYNHFDGKDGLLDAVVTDGFAEFGRAIAAADSDPTERLLASGRAYRAFALANPTLYSLMFGGMCRPDDATASGAFLALIEVVQYGQVGGIIRDDDPAALAMQIWSCVHGATSLELSSPMPPGADMDANYESVIALIARGVAPAEGT